MEYNQFMEALKGKQKKLDKNHNGELDSQDFAILRGQKKTNEEVEQLEEATVKTQKYSWGTMKTVHHGSDFSIPLHPEHHEAIAKLKDQQEHNFKTEDGKHWTAKRSGDDVHFQGANGGNSTKVKHSTMSEEVEQIDEIRRMKTKLNALDPISHISVARQKLSNLMKSGKAKGALVANKLRTLNMGDDIDQEDLDTLHEVLSKDAKAGDYISDFVHSTNPMFAGKSKKERIKMALGAYYSTNKKKDGISEQASTNLSEAVDPSEVAGAPNMYNADTVKKAYYHKNASESDKQSLARHLDRYHGNKEWRKPVKEESRYGRADAYTRDYRSSVSGFGRREREDDEYHVPDPTPIAPSPARKYIKGTPEHTAAKAAMKSRTGHPTNVKEEAEELEERNKQNALMRKTMDASRGARFKLNNPVPDASPEHKTAQAHNKAIGRALRNETKEETPPFDGPYTKTPGNVKDKSGAVHTPMSRARDLARKAMSNMAQKKVDEGKQDPAEYDQEGDMAKTQLRSIKYHADELHEMLSDNDNLPEWVQSKLTLAQDYLQTVCDYMYSQNEVNEEAYAGLEKEDKPGKIKTAVVKLHPKGVESETVEGWKDTKKPVKESFDDEGNLIPTKISYKDFITEIKLADLPVRRIQGHSYGANYTDPEGADDYDDKKPMKPTAEKRGRGRPAGAKSGARKITGTSKLMNK